MHILLLALRGRLGELSRDAGLPQEGLFLKGPCEIRA
jgi:hypothetical protein